MCVKCIVCQNDIEPNSKSWLNKKGEYTHICKPCYAETIKSPRRNVETAAYNSAKVYAGIKLDKSVLSIFEAYDYNYPQLYKSNKTNIKPNYDEVYEKSSFLYTMSNRV